MWELYSCCKSWERFTECIILTCSLLIRIGSVRLVLEFCFAALIHCFCAAYRFIGHILNRQSKNDKKIKFIEQRLHRHLKNCTWENCILLRSSGRLGVAISYMLVNDILQLLFECIDWWRKQIMAMAVFAEFIKS